MKMAVEEQVQRTAILRPQERLDAFSAPKMRAELDRLWESGVTNYVIDLSEMPFMDSAGMAVLVSLLRRCRQSGGSVKLVAPKFEPVRRTLQLTQFDRIFEFVQ
ncbi:MAG: STAS domain-containing protein [Anaerolineales bacterium]|nr:STAS domain-containing protein [Anaerolineales bacterium]